MLANEEKKACRDIGKNRLCRPFKIWCLCWRKSCHPLRIKLLKKSKKTAQLLFMARCHFPPASVKSPSGFDGCEAETGSFFITPCDRLDDIVELLSAPASG